MRERREQCRQLYDIVGTLEQRLANQADPSPPPADAHAGWKRRMTAGVHG